MTEIVKTAVCGDDRPSPRSGLSAQVLKLPLHIRSAKNNDRAACAPRAVVLTAAALLSGATAGGAHSPAGAAGPLALIVFAGPDVQRRL